MKSEKEKMLSGELYDASDTLLLDERRKARDLCHQLNATYFWDESAYKRIAVSLLPNAATDIQIEPPF
jgi:maltose O-acetyltransferase